MTPRFLWGVPTTGIGWLAIGLSGRSVQLRRSGPAVIATGEGVAQLLDRLNPRMSIGAMTLGTVVLARDEATAAFTWRHELVHVEQASRWGPLFLPAYGLASLVAALTGRDPYLDNFFEVEARSFAGR